MHTVYNCGASSTTRVCMHIMDIRAVVYSSYVLGIVRVIIILLIISSSSIILYRIMILIIQLCTHPVYPGGIIVNWQRRRDPGGGRIHNTTVCIHELRTS